MDIFNSIILGIVEGITEFLPVSSTGHMIVVASWLDMKQNDSVKAFEVIIQLAAILAIAISYRTKFRPAKIALWMKLFVAFLPLAIIGFIFSDQIKMLFNIKIVAVMFIVGGVIFIIVEKFFYKQNSIKISDIEAISYKQAFYIGSYQVFALIPGTSRAGATIIGGLLIGMSRKASAEFSFLLAVPVMLAVSGYDVLKHYEDFYGQNLAVLAIGFFISFLTAFISIKIFIKFLDNFTFISFGVYRIIFGIILLYFFV
jgi:undecaprenyl-diphosphatase